MLRHNFKNLIYIYIHYNSYLLYIIDEPINNIEKCIKVHLSVHCTLYNIEIYHIRYIQQIN